MYPLHSRESLAVMITKLEVNQVKKVWTSTGLELCISRVSVYLWNNSNISELPHTRPTLEKEMATHSSILASKIPCMEEPSRLQSMGSQRVGHD